MDEKMDEKTNAVKSNLEWIRNATTILQEKLDKDGYLTIADRDKILLDDSDEYRSPYIQYQLWVGDQDRWFQDMLKAQDICIEHLKASANDFAEYKKYRELFCDISYEIQNYLLMKYREDNPDAGDMSEIYYMTLEELKENEETDEV